MQSKNSASVLTHESVPLQSINFLVYNPESNVLVRRSSRNNQNAILGVRVVSENVVSRNCSFIDQIWIVYVEFVAGNNFWWRSVVVVVSLIVPVPLESGVDSVEMEERWESVKKQQVFEEQQVENRFLIVFFSNSGPTHCISASWVGTCPPSHTSSLSD